MPSLLPLSLHLSLCTLLSLSRSTSDGLMSLNPEVLRLVKCSSYDKPCKHTVIHRECWVTFYNLTLQVLTAVFSFDSTHHTQESYALLLLCLSFALPLSLYLSSHVHLCLLYPCSIFVSSRSKGPFHLVLCPYWWQNTFPYTCLHLLSFPLFLFLSFHFLSFPLTLFTFLSFLLTSLLSLLSFPFLSYILLPFHFLFFFIFIFFLLISFHLSCFPFLFFQFLSFHFQNKIYTLKPQLIIQLFEAYSSTFESILIQMMIGDTTVGTLQ